MAEGNAGIGVPPIETMRSMSGLDYLRGIAERRLPAPPIAALIGFDLSVVEKGFAVFTMTPEFKHYNPIASVHGGVAATLLDSCMSCAVQTQLEAGTGYTTLEIKINFVRAITDKTGPIRAEGRALYVGRRSATAEGKILDANGTLLAHGTTTCMVFPI